MILVTIGTSDPFDRLLEAVADLQAGEDMIVQCGASAIRPANARCVEFLPFDELEVLIERARVVVTHAGAGSVLTILAAGKRPIAIPRLRRYGEAVDDHQVEFGRELSDAGLVTLVENTGDLAAAVAAATSTGGPSRSRDGRLAADLHAYLRAVITPAGRRA